MPTPNYVPASFQLPGNVVTELQKADGILNVGNSAQQLGLALLKEIQKSKPESFHRWVTYFLFTKAFKSFQAAQILCRCGYGSDALSLCAVLFEDLVDLLYIGKAPVRRSRRYAEFEQVGKYYQALKVLGQRRLPKGRRKIYKNYASALFPQVKHLLAHYPNKSLGWSQKSLFDRARSVKAALAYQELYWVFCAHKHTLPMAAAGLAIPPEGYLNFTTGPDIKGVCDALEQSTKLFLSICLMIDGAFDLSLRPKIDSCLSELSRVIAAVRKQHPSMFR
ncbi:MAG: DUF5677 domain-containing protein [Candidatus Korobacteraceae bacterium]